MFKRRARLVLLTAALAAAVASVSAAKASANPIIFPVDFCTSAPATYTTTLPYDGGFSAWSVDTSYADSTCRRFIADIYAPAGTSPVGFELGGGAINQIAPITKATCLVLTGSLTIYRRGILQNGFTAVKIATFKGTWIAGPTPATTFCATWQDYTFNLGSGIFGAATYRIAVAAKSTVFGYPLPVTVGLDAECLVCFFGT